MDLAMMRPRDSNDAGKEILSPRAWRHSYEVERPRSDDQRHHAGDDAQVIMMRAIHSRAPTVSIARLRGTSQNP